MVSLLIGMKKISFNHTQVCVKLISDAITIGVLYCRIARPQGRASTILTSPLTDTATTEKKTLLGM